MAGDDYKEQHKNGDGGLIGYLRVQAIENAGPFMTLLGKVLPTQVEGSGKDGSIVVRVVKFGPDGDE